MKSIVERRTGVNSCGPNRTSARQVTGRQSGLTLIELVIALAIIGLIAGVIVMAVYQLLNASRQANDQQYAVSQLRQAEHWITRDSLAALVVTPDDLDTSGFPLQISWTTSADIDYVITYSLQEMPTGSLKRLQRQAEVDGTTSAFWVAEGIEVGDELGPPPSWCSYTRPVLTVTLTATSGTHTEARTFEAKVRSDMAN